MLFSIALLIVIIFIAIKASPVEKKENALVHGAGQIGLLAALALFGVDYFTSYFYATGEMMSALHPYNLQKYAYIAVIVIALANLIFGGLYMYSLGIFNEGGGSYTASMRYLAPGLSLVVAVVLIQDYIFTIVVSTLSGVDQLLSLRNATGIPWIWHFLIGAGLAAITWWLTIRGRGESARVTFTMLGVFVMMTIVMMVGLFIAKGQGVAAFPYAQPETNPSLGTAIYHMLTASMKGLVALSGLEAMSNGIQFVINEDAGIVKWGKKHMPRLKGLWEFYSGKSGIGRFVQTSFLFYGGVPQLPSWPISPFISMLSMARRRSFAGRQSGLSRFYSNARRKHSLLDLSDPGGGPAGAASMTAFQDLQATAWRDVAIGEIPEVVVYRNPKGTFTRSVTAGFIIAVIIQFLVRGRTSAAVPYYGIGVFMPIMVMGFAIRQHILKSYPRGSKRSWGAFGAGVAAAISAIIFVGQIVGKWTEGGWVVLISFTLLILAANLLLISPIGYRDPKQIYRIVREKARVQGAMASIVEWQSLKMQEYRYSLIAWLARFFELFGVRRPIGVEPPAPAGDYDHALHADHAEAPSLPATIP